ncbi:MAG: Spy/CpxP family protein refolding chaperone [Leptothrix sp. (in: b-proteobacteria)]
MSVNKQNLLRRGLFTLLGLGLSAGLVACGHGMAAERPDQPAGMGMMGGMGHGPMGGMGMDGGMGHHGPMSAADMQKHHERMIERISTALSLDATQKANLVKLGEAMQAQRKAMMGDDPAAMHTQMQALVAGDRFDTAKANALVNDKTEAMRKGSPQVIAAAATFFDGLKPEQQAKVREFMAKGPQHERHGWMHR